MSSLTSRMEVHYLVPRAMEAAVSDFVDFQTSPEHYRHWRLSIEGRSATLTMNVQEDGGILPGYKLKLNSYDLGVDIELYDALQRIRFEHPEVGSVVITSGKPRIFCSGANIYMLGLSSHAWKVNFCKFTNETRNGIEDSSAHSGLKFIAACNGATAGGGYELGSGLRRNRPDRRSVVGCQFARGSFARGAAGHRRADTADGQAARAPGPGGCILHHAGGCSGPARKRLGIGRRRGQTARVRGIRQEPCAGSGGSERPAQRRARRPLSPLER